MSRIGILTFHRSYNYGAFVQCYSLCQRLKQDFPNDDIEVIDYATERLYHNYPTTRREFIFGSKQKKNSKKAIARNIVKLILENKYLERRKILYHAFDEEASMLPLSDDRIISDDYEKFIASIKDKYDVIIVGSDGVWEFKAYPFPNAYFLNGDLGHTILMSYAASSDRMHYSELSMKEKAYLKEAFSRFSYIGIRDKATEMLVEQITGKHDFYHNCDPTVLLNINQLPKGLDRIKTELRSNGIDLDKPIIGIMGGNSVCKLVREMFGDKYQIVAVYYYSKYADYFLNDLTPIEWAQVFSLFSVTVTRFFHGSLLSLKNGCPTIATDDWYKVTDDHITKIGDLYQRLNLENHYFYMPEMNSRESINEMKNRIEYYINHPDKGEIAEALAKEAKSYDSFKNSLEINLGRKR